MSLRAFLPPRPPRLSALATSFFPPGVVPIQNQCMSNYHRLIQHKSSPNIYHYRESLGSDLGSNGELGLPWLLVSSKKCCNEAANQN